MHSLWADTVAEEGEIWRKFLRLLASIERPVLIHYGSYESIFLKRMRERHGGAPEGSAVANAIKSPVNLLSTIDARIYFPTYSNGLKEIAAYSDTAGRSVCIRTASITWREKWEQCGNSQDRKDLLLYNAGDCEALELTAQTVTQLSQSRPAAERSGVEVAVDVGCMKPARIFGFKRNTFFFPELDKINSAAYWDYQRERVYVRSNPLLQNALRKAGAAKRPHPNKMVQCDDRPPECPHCRSKDIVRNANQTKTVYDLKFFNGGIKRWVVRYHFQRYRCCQCLKTFADRQRTWTGSKFGRSILAYVVYQIIGLRMPQGAVDQTIRNLFGLQMAKTACAHFKFSAAGFYSGNVRTNFEESASRSSLTRG